MATRPVLTPRGEAQITRIQRAQFDLQKLWPQPEFKRFLFTILDRAHIFAGIYGDGRHLAFGEGRRSLGYDILRTLETIEPSALALVMQEEMKFQKEAPHAKSRKYDRHRELRGDGNPSDDPDLPAGDGLWLYGPAADAE